MRKPAVFPLLSTAALACGLTIVTPPDAGAVAARGASCGKPATAPGEERALLGRVRHARSRAGLPSLRGDKGLRRLARAHSARAARGAILSHTLPLPFQGIRRTGQNLARARDARTALALMLQSHTHRHVMLDPAFRRVGVGAVADCQGIVTYTLNFVSDRSA